jgi:hypothetical protein
MITVAGLPEVPAMVRASVMSKSPVAAAFSFAPGMVRV